LLEKVNSLLFTFLFGLLLEDSVAFVDDVMERIMNEQSAADSKSLFGHSGPVYSTSFSPDKNLMVSSSEDGTGIIFLILFIN
jgi:transcription initiation factor TFIID subunit 5